METDSTSILLGWFKIIFFIIFLIFIGYCLFLFYKERNEPYAVKRRPTLTILLVIVTIGPTISGTFTDEPTCTFTTCANMKLYHRQLAGLLPYLIQMILITLRVWFIFYDLKYHESLLLHKWWEAVNESQFKEDFFIKNRHKFGTLNISGWMSKLVMSLTVLWIAQVSIFLVISHILFSASYTAICVLLWCIQLYCFCKMGDNYDIYSIRKEISRLAIFYCFSSVYFGIAYIVVKDHFILKWITVFYIYCNSAIVSAICVLGPYYDNKRLLRDMNQPNTECEHTEKQDGIRYYQTWNEFGLLSIPVQVYISQCGICIILPT